MAQHQDKWASWLAERRFGGNRDLQQKTYRALNSIRDKIIENANIRDNDIVVDIGAGDGLLGFGVLEQKPEVSSVIFTDISEDALALCRAASSALNVGEKATFLPMPAQELSLQDSSVNVVVARAVYSYVKEKAQAFAETYRILKPGGRFSFSEPVNRFKHTNKSYYDFFGVDVAPIREIADKFFVAYGYPLKLDDNTMTDFDERNLLKMLQEAGFAQILLQYEARFSSKVTLPSWEAFYNFSPNPLAPTLKEALAQTLTPEEQQTAINFMKSFAENNTGTMFDAVAFCTAIKA